MDTNLVSEIFITKFEIKGKHVYAKVHWASNKSDLFTIQLFSDDHSWSGNFSYELAKLDEERLHETEFEYTENVKNALKRTSDVFIYDFVELETNPRESKFFWKKTFADSTAVLVHGCVTLQRDEPTESKDNIINYLLNDNKQLQNTIEVLKTNNELLNKELDDCKSEFEKLIDIKDSLESNLYGKFIQLLNSKKRRIKLLEDHIASIEGIYNA